MRHPGSQNANQETQQPSTLSIPLSRFEEVSDQPTTAVAVFNYNNKKLIDRSTYANELWIFLIQMIN
jgi:hypothetical protein